MPACSQGVCHCAWFWIHSPNSGSMQMYMNAFRCKITNTKSTAKKIGTPKVARRCGHDPVLNRNGDPKNCTVGAKQPLYWLQNERNNMFEGYYDPPFYNDLYGYKEGAQDDIFVNEQGNYEGGLQAAGAVHKTTTTHKSTTTHKTTHKTTTTHHKTSTTHHKTTTTHHHKTTTTTAKHSSCTKGSTDKKCKKKSHAKRNGDVPNVF
ncbi:hypothetical protein FRB90_006758 [Tulasnella sp. 427]|nr:hypothetical protein FRB90_006758 [Tulasnella sp. 427]